MLQLWRGARAGDEVSKRDQLIPIFRRWPRWALMLVMVFIGVPLAYVEHLALAWWEVTTGVGYELSETWNIDEEDA